MLLWELSLSIRRCLLRDGATSIRASKEVQLTFVLRLVNEEEQRSTTPPSHRLVGKDGSHTRHDDV